MNIIIITISSILSLKLCWLYPDNLQTIPVWEKYSLNVSEAAEYYGIGEKRLRQIAGENEGVDFLLNRI